MSSVVREIDRKRASENISRALLEREFWNNGAVAYIERITSGEFAIKFSIAPIT